MAASPDVLTIQRLVVWSVMLLLLKCSAVRGNYTIQTPESHSNGTSNELNIAAIVAPSVIGVLLVVLGVVAWLLCKVKEKRQTEGTYRPSAEEQSGVKSVVASDVLKLPKEERLI